MRFRWQGLPAHRKGHENLVLKIILEGRCLYEAGPWSSDWGLWSASSVAGDWDKPLKSRLDAAICVPTGMQEQDSPSIPEGHSEHGQVCVPIQSWESSTEWSACHMTSWPLTHMSADT